MTEELSSRALRPLARVIDVCAIPPSLRFAWQVSKLWLTRALLPFWKMTTFVPQVA